MEFSDIYLNSEEFFEILHDAWEKSEFFDGWEKRWHPEDIASNFEVVFDGVLQGIIAYSNLIGRNIRSKNAYSPDKKTVEDMNIQRANSASAQSVPVFGGTLPRGEWDNYEPTYAGNSVFGDNV